MGWRSARGALALLGVVGMLQAAAWAAPPGSGVVVKEGDTLPDGTLVEEIGESGVGINARGEVAFHGQVDSGSAVLTQSRVVVRAGDTLSDGTLVNSIINFASPAINARGEVVFEGTTGPGPRAVFNQRGAIVTVGDTLPDGFVLEFINPEPMALNARGIAPFQGRVLTQAQAQQPDPPTGARAVLTQASVVAKVGDVLPDGTSIDRLELRGAAVNDRGTIVFLGQTGDDAAILTRSGVVIKDGDTLADGTVVVEIETATPGLNARGDLAFIGTTGGVRAVFTLRGVVVRVGDTLPDGTEVVGIVGSGSHSSLELNARGTIAFRGETANGRAIFTQFGLVVEEGGTLPDGTTVVEIFRERIALNDRGEIAFTGRIDDGVPAVFVLR